MSESKINVDITDTEIRNMPHKTGISERTYITEFFILSLYQHFLLNPADPQLSQKSYVRHVKRLFIHIYL
jgi:hypothetical protein